MNWKTIEETMKRTQVPTVMLVAAMLASTAHAQTLQTAPGNDFTDLSRTQNFVYGNAGNDTIRGGYNFDILNGNAGNDAIYGEESPDALFGGIGNDFLDGGSGEGWLYGGSGNDVLRGGDLDDYIRGDYSDCAVLQNLPPGWSLTYNDEVGNRNYGNVSIEEGGMVYGPVDIVYFNDLVPTVIVSDPSYCRNKVQPGNDILLGGPGNDRLFGDEGSDWADYREAASGVVVDLALGEASDDGDGGSDILVGIENIFGSSKRDVLRGDQGANVLKGRGGHDVLEGRGGNDILKGDNGSDTYVFSPGDGHDRILRFASNDTIDVVAFGPSFTITEELVGADLVITVGNGSPDDVITITLVDFSGYVTYRKYGQLTA